MPISDVNTSFWLAICAQARQHLDLGDRGPDVERLVESDRRRDDGVDQLVERRQTRGSRACSGDRRSTARCARDERVVGFEFVQRRSTGHGFSSTRGWNGMPTLSRNLRACCPFGERTRTGRSFPALPTPAVRVPERFRGGCSFGVHRRRRRRTLPRVMIGLSCEPQASSDWPPSPRRASGSPT